MAEKEWVVLNYTLPKEPSRVRVSVWRKLKKCGAVIVGQSMWILPLSNEHMEIFDKISIEILQNGGEAYIMVSEFVSAESLEIVIAMFNRSRDEEYKEFLKKCEDFYQEIEKETEKKNFTFAEVEENEYEINKLVSWYKKITTRDFYHASLKDQSSKALDKCKEMLEDFSGKTYEMNDQNNT